MQRLGAQIGPNGLPKHMQFPREFSKIPDPQPSSQKSNGKAGRNANPACPRQRRQFDRTR